MYVLTTFVEVGKRHIMHFRPQDIACWVLKIYIFNTLVTLMLLKQVELWAISSFSSLGKSLKIPKSIFLQSFEPGQATNVAHPP